MKQVRFQIVRLEIPGAKPTILVRVGKRELHLSLDDFALSLTGRAVKATIADEITVTKKTSATPIKKKGKKKK